MVKFAKYSLLYVYHKISQHGIDALQLEANNLRCLISPFVLFLSKFVLIEYSMRRLAKVASKHQITYLVSCASFTAFLAANFACTNKACFITLVIHPTACEVL